MSLAQGIVDALTSGNQDTPELPLGPSIDVPASLVAQIASKVVRDYMDSRAHGKAIYDHSVHDHGIMYSDYFPGVSTVHTRWDDVYTGTGENAHEALDEALDDAAQDGWDVRSIKNEFDPESPDNVQNSIRANNPDMEDDDDTPDGVYYYVSIFVRGVPKGDVDEAQKPSGDILSQLGQVAIQAGKKTFEVGSILRGTSNSSDMVEGCLEALAGIDKAKFNEVSHDYSDEIELARRIGQGDAAAWGEIGVVNDFAYSTLGGIMQGYCPPFTYFGAHPGDGSDIGCWISMEELEDAAMDGEEVTKINAGSLEAMQLIQGNLPATTDYVWVHNEERNEDSLWDMRRKKPIWHY